MNADVVIIDTPAGTDYADAEIISAAAGAAAGAGVGGASGGIIGSLTSSGVTTEHAHFYAEGVRRGGTLVSARVDSDRVTAVEAIIAAVIGGCLQVFKRPGFEWDVGLHYIGEVHRPGTLLSLFNKVTRGELKWQKMPDIYNKIAVGENRARVAKHLNAAAVKERVDVAANEATLQKDLTAKGIVFNSPNTAPFRDKLRSAGFSLAATLVRGGDDLFAATLPQRLVYVMGAEGEGMDARLAEACDLRLSIPGSGAVESLNVAAATAVFLAQWKQRL